MTNHEKKTTMVFKSIFPYTQQVIAEYPVMDDAAINRCIDSAEKAYPIWKASSFDKRATILKKVASILKRDRYTLATLITNEMGKVIAEAKDPEAKLKEKENEFNELFANPYKAAERGYVDEVIRPEDTRKKLIAAFKMLENKVAKLPRKKHGNIPL